MASSHSRSASTADRRSINAAGIASRVRAPSIRAREVDKPFVRDDGSSILAENSANTGNADAAFDKSNRQISDFERRTERTFTTTKEKTIQTRSPVKESASAGNRREPERVRRSIQSPIEKKKAKDVGQGMLRRRANLQSALTVCRTLDSLGYIDTSFFCSSRHTGVSSAPIVHCARFPSTATSA